MPCKLFTDPLDGLDSRDKPASRNESVTDTLHQGAGSVPSTVAGSVPEAVSRFQGVHVIAACGFDPDKLESSLRPLGAVCGDVLGYPLARLSALIEIRVHGGSVVGKFGLYVGLLPVS